MQENISLACSACKRRNYTTTKNKKTNTDKLERSKFCRFCRKHTPHKEDLSHEFGSGGVARTGRAPVSKTGCWGSNPPPCHFPVEGRG